MTTGATPEERATNAAKDFMKSVNEMGFDKETFAKVVASDHRTLQQTAVGVAFAIIYKMAEKGENDVDLRNQQSVARCKEVVNALGENGKYFAFI